MSFSAINVLDMIDQIGLEATEDVISTFSNKRANDDQPLNAKIENFLKKNAIQFAKEKKSITYLVCDEADYSLLGYFTLKHKAVEIPSEGMSKTSIKKLEKHAKLHKVLGAYLVSAFLLAQLGKNYNVDNGTRITGSELMDLASRKLLGIQRQIGGGVEYLDCDANEKLINFYQVKHNFKLFGERFSEMDNQRYLQYVKFLNMLTDSQRV